MAQLKLLKVIVQPVFVKEDEDGLEEVNVQAVIVPAKLWAGFSAEAFGKQDCAAIATQMGLDGEET